MANKAILSSFSLAGKTAVITGAAAGIGLSIAEGFAQAGANIGLWYHSSDEAVDQASLLRVKYGVTCQPYQVDVTDPEMVESTLKQTVSDLNGRLDIFVANAGVPWKQGPLLACEIEHYKHVRSVILDGTVYCAMACGQIWKRQKETALNMTGTPLESFQSGSFIATASMSAHIVNEPRYQAPYNAAKAGVIHLCKSLAVEWADFARVNSVSPGYIITEISSHVPPEIKASWAEKTPMRRRGHPEELQGVYLYLASGTSSFTTGADIIVDGGYSLP